MTHLSEAEFQERVVGWYREHVEPTHVRTQVYQSDVRWFPDIIVSRPDVTLYIEVENDAASVRDGVGQALGYAGDDTMAGVPMVVVPEDHLWDERVERLRVGSRCLIRAFDAERCEWL